ncbi:hypothetical protein [Bacillus sp. ISL-7]|uniref:hypothetical protein n=1 Tax=Bacillus sp. ISL-7 TaxID=2819136 RepID=UPI001BE561D1|nr:hypothetical protein [Bacillus sp. ISL-7]MBT2738970.1 hypothetical protein [Bacillus sp. ISL-7]
MTVNHASTLKKEYFLSYINLVLISRNCSLKEAKEITMDLFFRNDPIRYGNQTYERFLDAYYQLESSIGGGRLMNEKGICCA